MKKIFLLTILISLAWGQTKNCQLDGYKLRRTIEYEWVEGKQLYLWECTINLDHKYWYVENPATPNSGITAQQVEDMYDPLIESLKDTRTEEQIRRDDEDLREWVKEMKKTRKGTIILWLVRVGIIYFFYWLTS